MEKFTLWITIDESSNCTMETRMVLLGDIRSMQNKASIGYGNWCNNICMNWNTLLFLQSFYHQPSVSDLENVIGTCKIVKNKSLNDGLICFKAEEI